MTGREALMSTLLEKIKSKVAKVGVIGLGYVGLPLAVEKAKAGFCVLGFDIQPEKVDKINRGETILVMWSRGVFYFIAKWSSFSHGRFFPYQGMRCFSDMCPHASG